MLFVALVIIARMTTKKLRAWNLPKNAVSTLKVTNIMKTNTMNIENAINQLITENQRAVQKYGVNDRSIARDAVINSVLKYYHDTQQRIETLTVERSRFPFLAAKFSCSTALLLT